MVISQKSIIFAPDFEIVRIITIKKFTIMTKLTIKERELLNVSNSNLPLSASHYCVVCSHDVSKKIVFVERFTTFRRQFAFAPLDYNDTNHFTYTLVRLY